MAMFQQEMPSILGWISTIGYDSSDTDDLRMRKIIGVTSVVLGGVPLMFGIGLVLIALGEPTAGLVCVSGSGLMLIGVLAFARSRNFGFYNIYWLGVTSISVFISCLTLGSLGQDGLLIIWGMVVPMIAVITNKLRYAILWFLAYAIQPVVLLLAGTHLRSSNNLSEQTILIMSAFNLTCFAGFVMFCVIYFVIQNEFLLKMLREEQAKSESLLHNIFPEKIADRLKSEERPIADDFPQASILFADIVNFTPLSATMSPSQLVDLLNQVFSLFDSLVEKHNLEKIKTIGDAYMVAAGVPTPRDDHAEALARFALDMRDAMDDYHRFSTTELKLRIGLNSGPVLAGVIGNRRFLYDLWGDSVNTASRMESYGIPGEIQISEITRHLLSDEFTCVERGIIDVKGKGPMRTYLLQNCN